MATKIIIEISDKEGKADDTFKMVGAIKVFQEMGAKITVMAEDLAMAAILHQWKETDKRVNK